MIVDEGARSVVSNGHATGSNGSTPRKPTNAVTNGRSPGRNGTSPTYTNGHNRLQPVVRDPVYRGHNREELTRILIQGLADMGYAATASTLVNESGYELESTAVKAFRASILDGGWTEAETILLGSSSDDSKSLKTNDTSYGSGLVLAEGANKEQMLFWIRQQKYLELLDDRDLGQALMVLRQELAPLNHDVQQLHMLSSLLMCPHEDLRTQARWPNTVTESRRDLLQLLTECIAPSVMIRDHRLAELLHQVKDAQMRQCLYHNTSTPLSLYADHACNQANFPSKTWIELQDHKDEVWHVAFSHDGTRLATASQDKTVIVYETTNFRPIYTLTQHLEEVVFVAWSPDDKKLISCSKDCKARVWDMNTGRILMELEHGTPDNKCPITSAAWAPDSMTFATTSQDSKAPICLWKLYSPEPQQPLHTWTPTDRMRSLECTITPDGQRLVAVDNKNTIRVYNLRTYREEYRKQFSSQPTSLTVGRDSKTLLINLAECEIHMFDLDEGATVRVFKGQKQGHFVIRSCFGGASENFVLSGSEDGKVYIWHKENAALIETLRGHSKGGTRDRVEHGCVTTVSWNPKDPGMFASGGDDRKVRIWTNSIGTNGSLVSSTDHGNRHELGRTSALRSTYRGDSNL